jgi:hypothetical protein
VWVILIIAEIIHGILRRMFILPVVGMVVGSQVGVYIGSALIMTIVYCASPYLHFQTARQRLNVGLLWLVLTLIFEFSFGYFVAGSSLESILLDYNLFAGGLLPFGMLILAFSPFFASRIEKSNVIPRT